MSEISQFHDLAEVCRKIDKPVEMSADAIICLDNEIVELERENTQLRGRESFEREKKIQAYVRVSTLEDAIRQARQLLRATQENWRELCLFDADRILTEAIGEN